MKRFFPILEWSRGYSRDTLSQDLVAAIIVTIMLIPQSLAYALLAGLPAEMGLYAASLPLIAYAAFASSRVLAVGPVAVVSLMTAAAIGNLSLSNPAEIAVAATALALMTGLMLLGMGLLRLGSLANFLSHPVVAGFMTAAVILIATSQVKHIFGISASGKDLITMLRTLFGNIGDTNLITVTIGLAGIAFLIWARKGLKPILLKTGMPDKLVSILVKTGPILVVAISTFITWAFGLVDHGVKVVGTLPSGLPPFTIPSFDLDLWRSLLGSAILITVVGFVESVSVAQTLAARRRQHISPDQELIGLGAANVASAVSGGYPVTGGFSRSIVNFDSGAQTPAAGAFTAVGILFAAVFLTPLLYFLPKASLAAIIVVAVLSLLDFSVLRKTWVYAKSDFVSVAATMLATLGFGVEIGVSAGVALSIAIHLYRTSHPHYAVVGQVPGTEHFRNINRHEVQVSPSIYSIRIDESLYFPNARFLEDTINDAVSLDPAIDHVILVCPAINFIDASALESLEAINHRLKDADVKFHLSEVKGPVMDRLKRTDFLEKLTGEVFLTQFDAVCALDPDCANRAYHDPHP